MAVDPRPSVRSVGVWAAGSVVVASMVGTGIFTTTGLLVSAVGSGPGVVGRVLLVWVLGGLLALCGAVVYGELGAMFPRSGGEYVYLARAFHPAAGLLAGLVSLVVGFAAPIAAAALAFANYAHALAPALPRTTVAICLIWTVAALHAFDVGFGSSAQTALTGLKLALLLLFGLGGLAVVFWQPGTALAPVPGAVPASLGAHAAALVLVSYSYSGWNAAAYLAGELRHPERTLPRALLVGTAIVTSLYVLINVVMFLAVPVAALEGVVEIGHVVGAALFGPRLGQVLTALIGLALASSVSSMLMAGPRVAVAMAEDGFLFAALAGRSTRGAPTRAVVLQASLASLIAATATFDRILYGVGFLLSLVAAATVAAAVVLRWREPERPRPYRALGWPLSPALFLLLSLGMAGSVIVQRPVESGLGLALLAVGAAVSWAARRRGNLPR